MRRSEPKSRQTARIADALLEPAHRALAEAAALVEQFVMEQESGRLHSGLSRILGVEKLPTMSKVQSSEPSSFRVQMVECSGILSPIFQPNFFISAEFAIAPVRVLR